MRSDAVKVFMLAVAMGMILPAVGQAQTLLEGGLVDFEGELAGTIPNSGGPSCCFKFFGPTDNPTFALEFSQEITETGGAGGSQAYHQVADGTKPLMEGGPGFWFAGVGQFYDFATTGNPLVEGVAGSNDPKNYRFTADVKVAGASIANPLIFTITNNDFDYEATYTVDINNDADLADGADVYQSVYQPNLLVTNEFQTVSFTLDQGTTQFQAGVLPEHQGVFTNEGSLLWAINWGAGQFGGDAGNELTIDNIKIEFFEPVALPGDYNEDGFVNAADYTVWRDHLGDAFELPNEDPDNLDGMVTQADYEFWKLNFGNGGDEGGLSVAGTVPEPGSILVALLGLAGGMMVRRTRR